MAVSLLILSTSASLSKQLILWEQMSERHRSLLSPTWTFSLFISFTLSASYKWSFSYRICLLALDKSTQFLMILSSKYLPSLFQCWFRIFNSSSLCLCNSFSLTSSSNISFCFSISILSSFSASKTAFLSNFSDSSLAFSASLFNSSSISLCFQLSASCLLLCFLAQFSTFCSCSLISLIFLSSSSPLLFNSLLSSSSTCFLQLPFHPNSNGFRFSQKHSRVTLKQLRLLSPKNRQSMNLYSPFISFLSRNSLISLLPIYPFCYTAMISNIQYWIIPYRSLRQTLRSLSLSSHCWMRFRNNILESVGCFQPLLGFRKGCSYFLNELRSISPYNQWSNLQNIMQSSLGDTLNLGCRQAERSLGVMILEFSEIEEKSLETSKSLLPASSCLTLSWAISASTISSKNSASTSCSCLLIINFITKPIKLNVFPTYNHQIIIIIPPPQLIGNIINLSPCQKTVIH